MNFIVHWFWSSQIYSVPWDINSTDYHFRLCHQKGHWRKIHREILKYETCQLIWAFHLSEVLFLGSVSLCCAKGHCKTWWRNIYFEKNDITFQCNSNYIQYNGNVKVYFEGRLRVLFALLRGNWDCVATEVEWHLELCTDYLLCIGC